MMAAGKGKVPFLQWGDAYNIGHTPKRLTLKSSPQANLNSFFFQQRKNMRLGVQGKQIKTCEELGERTEYDQNALYEIYIGEIKTLF